jgi:hypothetical protein
MSSLPLSCCPNAKWESVADLGHANSFDFILGRCRVCGKYWANLFCTASATTGYEKVTEHDAENLLSLNVNPGKKLKKAISRWLNENI